MTDARKKQLSRYAERAYQVATYALLTLFALLVLLPFYVILVTSLREQYDTMLNGFAWWPKVFDWAGYASIFKPSLYAISIPRAFLVTLLTVIPTVLVGLFFSSLAAFAFAKTKFRGNAIAFSVLLFTMMIPGTITMVPQSLMYAGLGWFNTFAPIMVPGMFGSATCVFFMRQFIKGIPNDLIEAAEIDGLGRFRTFLYIILPLCVPALISQGLLWFIAGYNDYLTPLIYISDLKMYPLQLALAQFRGQFATNIPSLMASSVITMLPLLIIYLTMQKYFIQGIAVSGMKD